MTFYDALGTFNTGRRPLIVTKTETIGTVRQ
jgi:hypothetical protein